MFTTPPTASAPKKTEFEPVWISTRSISSGGTGSSMLKWAVCGSFQRMPSTHTTTPAALEPRRWMSPNNPPATAGRKSTVAARASTSVTRRTGSRRSASPGMTVTSRVA